MARIAFFSERLPPDDDPVASFAFELMTSLAEQQHEVLVISTYRPGVEPPSVPRVQIIRPFRKWGWLEVPRLLPALFEFQPDILHVIQPRAEALEGMTNALNAIPGLAPVLNRAVVVSSFYDLRADGLRRYRLLLGASNAVTVMNQPQLERLEEHFKDVARKPKLVVLPASASTTDTVEEALPAALQSFLDRHEKIVFVPGDLDNHMRVDEVFGVFARTLFENGDAALVIGGGWGRVPARQRHRLMAELEDSGSRILVTGPLSAHAERVCLQRARTVFTASLAPESLQLTRVLRGALMCGSAILMSEEQAAIDPLPWQDRRSSVIASADPDSWQKKLHEALAADEMITGIKAALPEFSRSEAVDQPGNVMSRVYAELLARRR